MNNLFLHRIPQQFLALMNLLEISGGEISEELESEWKAINLKAEDAVFALQEIRSGLDSRCVAIKEEKKRLDSKLKATEKSLDWIKKTMVVLMQTIFPGHRDYPKKANKSIKNDLRTITIASGPVRVEEDNLSLIPDKYKKVILTMSVEYYKTLSLDRSRITVGEEIVDRTEISNLFKAAGIEVAGVIYASDDVVRVL